MPTHLDLVCFITGHPLAVFTFSPLENLVGVVFHMMSKDWVAKDFLCDLKRISPEKVHWLFGYIPVSPDLRAMPRRFFGH